MAIPRHAGCASAQYPPQRETDRAFLLVQGNNQRLTCPLAMLA